MVRDLCVERPPSSASTTTGAQPPGLGQQDHRPGLQFGRERGSAMSAKARRTAALLLPGCRMKTGRFEFPDTTGFNLIIRPFSAACQLARQKLGSLSAQISSFPLTIYTDLKAKSGRPSKLTLREPGSATGRPARPPETAQRQAETLTLTCPDRAATRSATSMP